MEQLRLIEGGTITHVPGFRAAGVACGIKKRGAHDLAMIVSDQPCVGAAVFTTNKIQSPGVTFDRDLLHSRQGEILALVVNSGCANAITGEQGHQNARSMSRLGAQALGDADAAVFVMSTGVIGQQLPMDRVAAGIEQATAALQYGPDAGHAAARAIMTTDTRPKEAAGSVDLDGVTITLGGICKGSGMIHPDMATMLAMVVTDAAIAPAALEAAVRYAADRSFNAVTIDGDASTNDTFVVLANGQADNPRIEAPEGSAYRTFRDALTAVAVQLAQEIARDGEGATKFVTITVRGATTFDQARQGARVIATSMLVKTAIFGTDANWGRVLAAVGRGGIDLDPTRLALWFDEVQLVADGAPLHYSEDEAHATLVKPEVTITVDLGVGDAAATVWTCDLSHDYVSINADYRT